MATSQISLKQWTFGGAHVYQYRIQLITSGTTVTITPPVKVWTVLGYRNATTNAVDATTGTLTESTNAWVSPTMSVNDICEVAFLTD